MFQQIVQAYPYQSGRCEIDLLPAILQAEEVGVEREQGEDPDSEPDDEDLHRRVMLEEVLRRYEGQSPDEDREERQSMSHGLAVHAAGFYNFDIWICI